ncbi:ATP-binding cassette domain-containing protein [Pseudoroseicyclus tamaricis]|uniref:Metal ABC transporter ATP-binding protein n=1 Tax=Pseudoroseicyclus tamaricis TaxID=2705421 RepID=A0A6B2JT16_9RHOB|nr:metal ABC transporter ATP-binding protein [Pseudoroseicyclus tamaricis]NDU99708.1 metal ABC transporter ATP-binding protein [Pseudoroseicyclus tamaricis]
MSLVALERVGVSLGGRRVLEGVSLAIEPGEIVTVVGPNGSGKTTLMRLVIGALTPSEGRVLRAPGLTVGYVPQKLHVDPGLPLSVRRFLSLPRPVSRAEAAGALEEAGVGHLAGRQMTELSGGQAQRVMLARALTARPQLLILDEPTQGLDQQGSAAFYRQIEELRQRHGCAILLVSHDLHVVMAATDRVICLNGHVCCEGAPAQVASAPEYRALFGTGTQGALALYRHEHDHGHDHAAHAHAHGPEDGAADARGLALDAAGPHGAGAGPGTGTGAS